MMKISTPFIIFLLSISVLACSKGNQMNGRSLKSANRSASYIKDRLPVPKRVEFEVSFWSLRDEIRSKDEFLDTIDGKIPEEIIELGKQLFNKRKQAGVEEYQKFANWDDMISQYTAERKNIGPEKIPEEQRQQPSVLYNL